MFGCFWVLDVGGFRDFGCFGGVLGMCGGVTFGYFYEDFEVFGCFLPF